MFACLLLRSLSCLTFRDIRAQDERAVYDKEPSTSSNTYLSGSVCSHSLGDRCERLNGWQNGLLPGFAGLLNGALSRLVLRLGGLLVLLQPPHC